MLDSQMIPEILVAYGQIQKFLWSSIRRFFISPFLWRKIIALFGSSLAFI